MHKASKKKYFWTKVSERMEKCVSFLFPPPILYSKYIPPGKFLLIKMKIIFFLILGVGGSCRLTVNTCGDGQVGHPKFSQVTWRSSLILAGNS